MTTPATGSDAPVPSRDDATLAALLRSDAEGLRRLIADHYAVVQTKLRRAFVGALDDLEVEDAMSRALERIWREPGRIHRQHGSLRAWLWVLARNGALHVLAAKRRLSLVSLEVLQDALVQIADNEPDQRRLRRITDLHHCLGALPIRQRQVLLADLRADGQAPSGPLARELGTTVHAVHAARSRGRSRLRRLLARLGHSDAAADQPTPVAPPATSDQPQVGFG